jgi:hypothetical protein
MKPELSIPYITSNVWLLLGTLVVFLVILHVVLIYWMKLNKVWWKRVDYIWLAFAALSLLGAASEVRRLIAGNLVELQRHRVISDYNFLRQQAEFGTGPVYCRKFIPSEFSPSNLGELQRDYDLACEYYKALYASLPQQNPDKLEQVNILGALKKPAVSNKGLREDFDRIDELISLYNRSQDELNKLTEAQQRSRYEVDFIVLSPLLLVFALALRITKVTGEIRLEKQ